MEIRITSFFGLTEIAYLPVDAWRVQRTATGAFVHFSLNGLVLVSVDTEQRRILYADRTVMVEHRFEGHVQRFRGICAA